MRYKNSLSTININSEFLWVLDPLDGTKDFIQGTSNYAMHLALNHNQKPLLGIVFDSRQKSIMDSKWKTSMV